MKPYKYLLLLAIIGAFASLPAADREDGGREDHDAQTDTRDLQSLRTFVTEKRAIDLKEKSTNLSISGDVRTEWRHMREKFLGHQVRDGEDCNDIPLSRNDFDIEFNLRFDYSTDKAWAYAHVQFDNPAGVERNPCNECFKERFHGSGICDSICLKRAYMGYDIFDDKKCGGGNLWVEIGRQQLYDAFESDIEFDARMDGILLVYESKWEHVSEWYIQAAGFLVDERVNQFAYAAEIAFYNINDSGFDIKYSFIDWRKRGEDRCCLRNPRGFKYANSQVILTYHLDPELVCIPVEIYGAALFNHCGRKAARKGDLLFDSVSGSSSSSESISSSSDCSASETEILDRDFKQSQRWGFYAGITFGEVEYEGDWSLDISYQWVGKYAIAYDDESGIGSGNFLDDCCSHKGVFPTTGYKGWRFDALYALTDNLTVQTIIEWSKSTENNPRFSDHHTKKHNYSKVEVEAVYAF